MCLCAYVSVDQQAFENPAQHSQVNDIRYRQPTQHSWVSAAHATFRGSPRSIRGILLTPTSREYKKGCPGLRLFACECNFRTYGLSGVVVRYDEHMADVHMGLG